MAGFSTRWADQVGRALRLQTEILADLMRYQGPVSELDEANAKMRELEAMFKPRIDAAD